MNKKQKEERRKKVRDNQARCRKINLALEQMRLQRKCREIFGKQRMKQKSDEVGVLTDGEIIDITS